MNKKLLAVLCLVVALVASALIASLTQGYQNVTFYLLSQGEGHFTPTEGFFLPDSQAGPGLWVAPSGQVKQQPRLHASVSLPSGPVTVEYYLYHNAIFPLGEEFLPFYARNTQEEFLLPADGALYRVNVAENTLRPWLEGSTLYDEYGRGLQGVSTDGRYAAGAAGDVLTLVELEESRVTQVHRLELAQQGYSQVQVLRFLNGVHLWFQAVKNGVSGWYVLDCQTHQVAACPTSPAGLQAPIYGRCWQLGPLQQDEQRLTQQVFGIFTGQSHTLSLSRQEFSAFHVLDVSSNGAYLALQVTKLSGESYCAVYRTENGQLTLLEERPQSVYFASDQTLLLNLESGYRLVRILH